MHAAMNRSWAFCIGVAAVAFSFSADDEQASAQGRSERSAAVDEGSLPPPADPDPGEDEVAPDVPASLGVSIDPRFDDAVVIRSVTPGGSAEHAGLQAGDTIEALNGNRVDRYQDVIEIIERLRAGDIVDIDFSRRISGRTQAVLNARPQEGPTFAEQEGPTFAEDEPARFEPAPTEQAYEELPSPPMAWDRSAPRRPPRAREPLYLDPRYPDRYDDRQASRDEPEQRRRLFNRGDDRGPRRRALLPWRRN